MQNNLQQITNTIEDYFQGTYQADEIRINKAFHPDVKITGKFDGNYIEMDLKQFIQRVMATKNQTYDYAKQIIAIDIHKDIAIVKADVLVGDNRFIDYITLINIDNNWQIRQKSFTNA